MSLTCKFGDEEDWEEVKCTYDQETDKVLCRRPLKKLGGRYSELISGKMEISLDGANSVPQVVSPFLINGVAEEEIEMNQLSRSSLKNVSNKESPKSRWMCSNWLMVTIIGCVGELFGTLLMTAIICTVIASSVITGSQTGVWQVALPSGLAVTIGIYLTAHISDGHLNPAVTLAFSIVRWKQFRFYRTIPYIISQTFGAFLAAGTVYLLYYETIIDFEMSHNITRGQDGSQLTATIFARYFPNPLVYHVDHDDVMAHNFTLVPVWKALMVETWATFILVFVIFGLTHPSNTTIVKHSVFVPVIVGITIAILISIFGPLTQAGLNPAFDFGPRLFAALTGWGRIAIPGPRYGFWVYIVGPFIGGTLGGATSDIMQHIVNRLKHRKTIIDT